MIHLMVSRFSKLFAFLRNPLGAKPAAGKPLRAPAPPPSAIPPITAQDLRKNAYLNLKDREAALAREQAEREEKMRQADPVYRFVHDGEVKTWPQSSNVHSCWYEIRQQQLFVQFHDGSLYRYESVTVGEAQAFVLSTSAGTFVWDNLRIRGTKLGARKEYHLVFSGGKERLWEQTPEAARTHAEKVAAESGANVHEKLGKFSLKTPMKNKGRRPPPPAEF